ncbi:hypothetical protein ACLKA6_001718 [Drosophila palustris]
MRAPTPTNGRRVRVVIATAAAAILDVRESDHAAAMLLASYRHSPAAAAVVKFCDVTEISEQEAHVVCACAAILCLSAMPQQRRSRRLLNECACVVPGTGMVG